MLGRFGGQEGFEFCHEVADVVQVALYYFRGQLVLVEVDVQVVSLGEQTEQL